MAESVLTLAWVLPRPKPDCYPGGFPLHFEKKLIGILGNPSRILHPFGGMAQYGLRLDILKEHPYSATFGKEVKWYPPDLQADAHHLPFKDNTFDLVICDPPYSKEQSRSMYGTGKITYKRYIAEAVRVCCSGGYIASYHVVMTPRPIGTEYYCRILLGTRVFHRLRACCIFKKIGKEMLVG